MNKFKGILFTLKKRIENISENDNDYYKYLVMGYYDGLEINTVDQWLQTATFRGQQGRISRPVKAILSGRL